jgi:hypothetical protein
VGKPSTRSQISENREFTWERNCMNAKNVENPSTISHPFLYIKEVHTEGEAL